MILPLALGADSGRRMGPTGQVIPLKSAPERPQIELVVTLAPGDSFATMLRRAGVSAGDIDRAAALIGQTVPLDDITPGTQIDVLLGRRPAPGQPRPLDSLAFRARFDLELELSRPGVGEIAEDGTSVIPSGRWRSNATSSAWMKPRCACAARSAPACTVRLRQAGVPASAVQEYLKALDSQIDMDREVRSSDEFDIILAYRRAATGERQAGQLLYAGVDRAGKPRTQLMRWGKDGRFYEASAVGEQRGGLLAPGAGADHLELRNAPPPDSRLQADAFGHGFQGALRHGDCRGQRRAGQCRGPRRRLRYRGAAGAWRRACDPLLPHEPHGGEPRSAGAARAGDRLCRLHRAFDRPAPALRNVSRRAGDQSGQRQFCKPRRTQRHRTDRFPPPADPAEGGRDRRGAQGSRTAADRGDRAGARDREDRPGRQKERGGPDRRARCNEGLSRGGDCA